MLDAAPERLQEVAAGGIDKTTKAKYDVLFERWIECPYNMAANRQTRSLGQRLDVRVNDRVKALGAGLLDPDPEDRCEAQGRATRCRSSRGLGSTRSGCSSGSSRRSSGLRFHADKCARVRADEGKGAHRVAKLRYASLTALVQAARRRAHRNDLLVYEEARHTSSRGCARTGSRDACAS